MNRFDPRAFRNALGSYTTGVAVITTRTQDGSAAGLTINSFASVSLDPPLVLWSLSLYSLSLPAFQNCSHYAINVLAQDQQALSQRFAAPQADKFVGLDFTVGAGGALLLPGCCAWFECRNETHHAGGDHLIFVGQVESFARFDRPPLVFQGGQYRQLDPSLNGQR
ncbi:FMN reductase (NADH) NtaB [mine drainage metagenome]|uniref:FMN reductase (NADH) NtaB n=1 Tax=mine drainage metagenome TaxID=410659 RepID=A0A1J5SBF0_9ZZZZ